MSKSWSSGGFQKISKSSRSEYDADEYRNKDKKHRKKSRSRNQKLSEVSSVDDSLDDNEYSPLDVDYEPYN